MSEDDHSHANELFTDYQEKTLSDTDKTFLEGHLSVCVACHAEWDKYQQVMSALSGWKQKPPSTEATPDILQGAAQKINRRTRGLFFRQSRFGLSYEVIAALFLLIFGAAYLVLHLMRAPEVGQPAPGPSPSTAPVTPSPKQGALLPRPKDEPHIQGMLVEHYTMALHAVYSDETSRQLARIALTASGSLSDWHDTPQGPTAEFTVPYNKFLNFYRDLGASYTWEETKTTERMAQMNPPVQGTLILRQQ